MAETLVPARCQAKLPLDRLVQFRGPRGRRRPARRGLRGSRACVAGRRDPPRTAGAPGEGRGVFPDVEIGVLEKAEELGQHSLSGAVVNPRVLRALFPDRAGRGTSPSACRSRPRRSTSSPAEGAGGSRPRAPMKNHGNYTASLGEIVRWLGKKAEGLGINLFTGFPAETLLVEGDGWWGCGPRPRAWTARASPGAATSPRPSRRAGVGARRRQPGRRRPGLAEWHGVTSPNPQIYALGVKEIWETRSRAPRRT